jgi:hypothetical protein
MYKNLSAPGFMVLKFSVLEYRLVEGVYDRISVEKVYNL